MAIHLQLTDCFLFLSPLLTFALPRLPLSFSSLVQFELDIEPRLKPSLSGGGGGQGGGLNDSQDLSFSQAPTKGMQPLRETVSEIEMLTRAGKPMPSPIPPYLHFYTPVSENPESTPLLLSSLCCLFTSVYC